MGVRQHTQDVRVCPPAHTGRLWLSVAVHQHTQDVRGCLCVSVCVRQHTQDVRGCPSAHTGRPCVSVSTHRMSVCVRQHKLDVRGCPSAHTELPWLSISTHIRTLALSVNCLCTDLDMSSSFVDWTVQVSLIDASPSSNELMVQVYLCWLDFS